MIEPVALSAFSIALPATPKMMLQLAPRLRDRELGARNEDGDAYAAFPAPQPDNRHCGLQRWLGIVTRSRACAAELVGRPLAAPWGRPQC
jgi:hypothetical protein